jgi:hypothetical protein
VLRRSLLRAVLGTGTLSLSAGCNGLFGADPDAAAPAPTRVRTATAAPERPHRAADAPTLDRPQGVSVRNYGPTERFLTLVVRDGDRDVFVASRTVAAGESVAFVDLIATTGDYRVVVETADGGRYRGEWAVSDAFEDLRIELTPEVGVRRLARCTPDCGPVSVGGEVGVSFEIRTDVSAADALGRPPAIALDNGAADARRARLRVRDGDGLQFDYEYVLPAGVRAVVPVRPSRPQCRVTVRTDEGAVGHDWVPGVREPSTPSSTTGRGSAADSQLTTSRCGTRPTRPGT